MRRSLLVVLVLISSLHADTVVTKDKKRYDGRIVRENESEVVILTYADGEIAVPKSNLQSKSKGKNKWDDYDQKLAKDAPQTAAAQFAFGNWCKQQGLISAAKKHWELAVAADSNFEAARKALGHMKDGDRWVTEDEYYQAKGWVKSDGQWMSPDEAKKRREAKLAGQIKEKVKIEITFEPNAPKSQLESWIPKVKLWSKAIWDITGGAVYLDEVKITDQASSGHCVVVNLDQLNLPDGNSGKARNGAHKFWVGGLCNTFVFVHEFFHAWASVPDHYGTKIECLMNSSERGQIFQWKFCDPCWQMVKNTWKLPFRPEFDASRELTPECPGKHGAPKDYGEPPETKVTVVDKP
jgi:hypothetical protein